MKAEKIVCFYHPTTTVIVDDDEIFLRNIALKLDINIPYKTYQDPKLALADLKQLQTQNQFLANTITVSANLSEDGKHPVDFNVNAIYQQAYNKDLFNEVSVIVVDYSMAKMNGADLLRNLVDVPVKKIMLTGQADEALAVQLFNDGIIDKFILKGSVSLQKLLNDSISALQKSYFHDLSDIILKLLPGQLKCFSDPVFIKFFNQLLVDNSISSYYLLDTSGSFLLLDGSGSPTWFLVKSSEEMHEFSFQAQSEGASPEIVQQLSSGEKMAYFSNFDQYLDATYGNWDEYLHPTKSLAGKTEYKYVITNNMPGFSLDQSKILSFNDYLHSGLSAKNIT